MKLTPTKRFSRWAKKGVWQRLFEANSVDPDLEEVLMDSTTVRAHQHAAGAQKKPAPRPWGVPEADLALRTRRW